MTERFFYSSEQISEGHPDKLCDYISDAILDAALEQDPASRVACETMIKNNAIIVAGEINTKATLNYEQVIRKSLLDLGYDGGELVLDPKTANILLIIDKQSVEISNSIQISKNEEDIGAGDQGIMFGYATNETPEFLPLNLVLSTNILQEIKRTGKETSSMRLGPYAKCQVTVEYEYTNGRKLAPVRVDSVIVLVQHKNESDIEKIRLFINQNILQKVIPQSLLDAQTKLLVNPSGPIVMGGDNASETGITGRKIIADTYGGWGAHGGGAFSGKDATKVDRSGAYAARWIAKSLVANGHCDRCTVQLSYGIGMAEPINVHIDAFGTAKNNLKNQDLVKLVLANFDLRPGVLIRELGLMRPIYRQTCLYNHFMPKPTSTWEVVKKF
jgi:S-adenosylmethionine synthetase